jgi:hypothetical protein
MNEFRPFGCEDGKHGVVFKMTVPSFRRTPESRFSKEWTPAFTGVTTSSIRYLQTVKRPSVFLISRNS